MLLTKITAAQPSDWLASLEFLLASQSEHVFQSQPFLFLC